MRRLRSGRPLGPQRDGHQRREYKSPYDWCQLVYHHGSKECRARRHESVLTDQNRRMREDIEGGAGINWGGGRLFAREEEEVMMEERGGRGRQKPLEICDVAIQCLVWGASSSLSADQGTTSVWGQDKIERAPSPMKICIATMR